MALPNCDYTYLARVTPTTLLPAPSVYIYTTPTTSTNGVSKLVTGFTFSGMKTLCFKEDPASIVHNLTIGLDSCPACSLHEWDSATKTFWAQVNGPLLSTSDGGPLLLNATAGTLQYHAPNNPGIDGGRPIIRGPLDITVVVIVVGIAILAGILIWKLRTRFEMPEKTLPR